MSDYFGCPNCGIIDFQIVESQAQIVSTGFLKTASGRLVRQDEEVAAIFDHELIRVICSGCKSDLDLTDQEVAA